MRRWHWYKPQKWNLINFSPWEDLPFWRAYFFFFLCWLIVSSCYWVRGRFTSFHFIMNLQDPDISSCSVNGIMKMSKATKLPVWHYNHKSYSLLFRFVTVNIILSVQLCETHNSQQSRWRGVEAFPSHLLQTAQSDPCRLRHVAHTDRAVCRQLINMLSHCKDQSWQASDRAWKSVWQWGRERSRQWCIW